ncbi:hypothetical protein G8759_31390 [Spirosoma aureum]|uniref:SGNH/GDSL hydrolase family protein n=1 Tax=Spirosoma aureum TaxID=2692134 RepID=A0A6G9AWW6_9BACT|nr:hypothetical protein [Spirosoma aureum]QIP16829.1 hypothetical protein G8759_31390 [Spirosoma aureum]
MATEHLIVESFSSGVNAYQITVERDLTKFPRTIKGNEAFEKAVRGGGFPCTVVGTGCMIPKGTRLTLIPPDCSSNPNPTPVTYSWGYFGGNSFNFVPIIPSSEWTHGSGMAASSLDKDFAHRLEAKIKTRYPAFQAYVTSQLSPFETEYLTDDYNYAARITGDLNTNFSNSPPAFDLIDLSIGENIDEGTFNKTKFFAELDQLIATIPKAATYTVMLRSSFWGGHTVSSAALQEYATLHDYLFVDFSDRVDYPAYQSDYDDAGIARHWNDDGHELIAERKASKLGITTGSSASSDFVSQTDEGWSKTDDNLKLKYIENDLIKVGFLRDTGAVIGYAAFKSTNRNLVNDYQVDNALPGDPRHGTVFGDKGRQWMWKGSLYWTPGSGWQVVPGKNTNQYGFDTGGNVVEGGSLGPFYDESEVLASRIYNHPKYGQMFYSKIRPRVWAVPGEYVDIVEEGWAWLQGTSIAYFSRQIIGPGITNPQMIYQARAQELPCLYSLAPFTYVRMADANSAPWTNSYVDRFKSDFSDNQNFTKAYMTPECLVTHGEGPDSVTVGLYTPGIDRGDGVRVGLNSRFNTGQFVGVFGEWDDNASSYVNANPLVNYDNPGTYENAGYIVLGTSFSDVRSKVNALPRPDQSFDFDFTTDNHRWWNFDCRMIKENGLWKVYIGDVKTDNNVTSANGIFAAPYGAWEASGIQTIEFDMKVEGITALWLEWYKPGEENDQSKVHRKAFTGLIGDGVRRTYSISTADPNWNGIVTSVGLRATKVNEGLPITNGGHVIPYRFRKV